MSTFMSKKPLMAKKILNVARAIIENPKAKVFAPSGFILNYSNKCNFTCPHCYTGSGSGEYSDPQLSMDDLRSLADQADSLGVYEIDIQGGEPLAFPNLFSILESLITSRFYVYITTNGWLMTQDLADRLANSGVDRISVSIDSFSAESHDAFRNKQGSFERAFNALECTKKAGMKPYVNIVIGHYNAQRPELADFCTRIINSGCGIGFNCATPTGNWHGNYDVMMTEDDTLAIEMLRGKNVQLIRDLWNIFVVRDVQLVKGCPSVNLFYVNPNGDVLPCPYIQGSMGNIRQKPLKEILERGFSFKPFNTYSKLCLAGEDRAFAKKYLSRKTSILNPLDLAEFMQA